MSEVIIIGGGVSGLSAGIHALKNGMKATVIEKWIYAGGNLTGWTRQDVPIDLCIHWLTGTNKNTNMYKMWETLGALNDDVEILKPDTLFTVEHKGQRLSLYRSLDKTVSEMLKISPSDKRNILSFKKACEAMEGFLGIYGPDHNVKFNGTDFLPYLPSLLKYFSHSIGEIAASFKHPLLKLFINSLMGTEFNAIDLAFVTATFVGDNADLPKGLSKPMAERMTDRFLELGGNLITGKEVVKLNRQGAHALSVTLKTGEELTADDFIATIDPELFFSKLTDVSMPKALKKQYNNKNYLYFSSYHLEYDLSLPEVDFEENLFLPVPEDLREVIENRRIMVRTFTVAKEMSAEGHTNLQVMVYCLEDEINNWINLYESDREAYKALKSEKEKAISELLIRRFPEFKDKLKLVDMWTPASFKRYTSAHMGTYQSFINPKWKAPKRISPKINGLDNVYLGSQWLMSPGGLPIAALTGMCAANAIGKKYNS